MIKAVDAIGGTKKPLLYLVDSTLQKFTMKNMNQYVTCKTASNYKKGAVSADYTFFLILLLIEIHYFLEINKMLKYLCVSLQKKIFIIADGVILRE